MGEKFSGAGEEFGLWMQMYSKMFLIRIFEERVVELIKGQLLWGTAHAYIGQEAVAVGVCSALRRDDYITSTHRGHGHCIAKGADLGRMMAELMGKATGYCKGKGGSMHICDVEGGNLGANGIVGGGIPIATGAALGAKMQGSDRVAVAFFGDGAINLGIFHESLNMGAAWKLPVVYICENNLYSISVLIREVIAIADITERARAYGMPGYSVDGNDVLAVYEAAREAVRRARAGSGPTFIECKTYRLKAHSAGVPWEPHPEGEIREWTGRDPLRVFRTRLVEGTELGPTLDELEKEARLALERACEFAQESPDPAIDSLTEDIYA
jgi:TPP-dependent pyruvate/acetoin dehydrogenase alpha subunit